MLAISLSLLPSILKTYKCPTLSTVLKTFFNSEKLLNLLSFIILNQPSKAGLHAGNKSFASTILFLL